MHEEMSDGRAGVRGRPGSATSGCACCVPVDVDDAVLLSAAHRGCGTAWEALVDRHAAGVWRWARRACRGDEAAAEAVSATTWLRLAQSLGPVPHPRLLAWLGATVRSEAEAYRRATGAPRRTG